jgi:uncharacterized membrane protein YfcA
MRMRASQYVLEMSEPIRVGLTIVAGVLTGMLSGAFGAGGGVVSTPAIRLLGASALDSVGSTLPPIFPSAIAGGLRYHRQGFVQWGAVRRLVLVGMPSAAGFAWLGHQIPGDGHVLMLITALLVAITGYRMLTQREPKGLDSIAPETPAEPHAPKGVPTWVGICAGGMSGLLGIGGGVIMVPVLVNRISFPIKLALGTSLVSAGCFAVPATITHWSLGGIDWSFAIPLAIGVIPGSRIGSALSIRADAERLRAAVSIFLMLVAAVLATRELIDWLG